MKKILFNFKTMNNFALKLVKEKDCLSLKIHDLIKLPGTEFKNLKKQSLYEKGKYYHKNQRGMLRLSKYEFSSSEKYRNILLKKHDIEIFKVDSNFDYAQSKSPDQKIWYMNFSDKEIFTNWDSEASSLSDLQMIEMPLLHKVNQYLNSDNYSFFTPTTFYKDWKYTYPTPILLEKVPQWYEIKNPADIEKRIPITMDKFNNLICMVAPNVVSGEYLEEHLYYLCATLFAGFGGIVGQGIKSKAKNIELHTGNWGCGNLGNAPELMYLSQMLVASIMGVKKIYFHRVDGEAFENAKRKFEVIVEEFSYEELVAYLLAQGYRK